MLLLGDRNFEVTALVDEIYAEIVVRCQVGPAPGRRARTDQCLAVVL
ncbi:hypothetical protein [Nocardia sp. NPDC004604]